MLRTVFAITLLCTFPTSVYAEPGTVVLAYLENGLSELRNNEKRAALQLLADELTKESGLQMTIKSVKAFSEMQDLMTQEKIDFVILNSYHYINHHDFFEQHIIEPLWAIQRGPLERENYILVASKQDAHQDLNSFRGKKVSLHPQYLLMQLYLETIIKHSSGLDSVHFFKKIKQTKTASQAVLDVYFGTSDLSIVPEHIFDLTVELNPAILKKLSIVHQSGEFFFPVLAFGFSHVNEDIRHVINKNLATLADTPRGEKILELFNIQSIKQVMPEQLQLMHNLFLNYPSFQAN